MTIHIERDRSFGMSQAPGDYNHRDTIVEHQGSGSMAQVVKPDGGQAGIVLGLSHGVDTDLPIKKLVIQILNSLCRRSLILRNPRLGLM